MHAAQALGGRRQRKDPVVDPARGVGLAHEAAFELHHRQRQPRQQLVVALVAEIIAQQAQARVERLACSPYTAAARGRIDPEHAVQRRADDGLVGLPVLGDLPHLPQCLHQAGEGKYAFVHVTHAA